MSLIDTGGGGGGVGFGIWAVYESCDAIIIIEWHNHTRSHNVTMMQESDTSNQDVSKIVATLILN